MQQKLTTDFELNIQEKRWLPPRIILKISETSREYDGSQFAFSDVNFSDATLFKDQRDNKHRLTILNNEMGYILI